MNPAKKKRMEDRERLREPAASESGLRRLPEDPESASYDHRRWEELGAAFVDDPVSAVREADDLVRKQIHAVVNALTQTQSRLRLRWDGHDEATTEELRECFQEYRALARKLAEERRRG